MRPTSGRGKEHIAERLNMKIQICVTLQTVASSPLLTNSAADPLTVTPTASASASLMNLDAQPEAAVVSSILSEHPVLE